MLNLIRNENMKIYLRLRTWILVAILLIIEGLAYWVYYKTVGGSVENMWESVMFSGAFLLSVPLFLAVIIAADSVAGEFSGGTIKLLLIRPASRLKILLSKYISVFIYLLFLTFVLFITSYIISGLMFGFGSTSDMINYTGKDGAMHHMSYIAGTLRAYCLGSIELIMILSLAFMVSSVFRSSAIAITISIVLIFVGQTIAQIINSFSWSKYYLFSNTDLSKYFQSGPLSDSDSTLQFSILILVIYFVIFNGLSWYVFKKRDVAS